MEICSTPIETYILFLISFTLLLAYLRERNLRRELADHVNTWKRKFAQERQRALNYKSMAKSLRKKLN